MKKVRLHQYLSKSAVFSSKQAIWDAIQKGEIEVNGTITRNPDFQLRITKTVLWKGKPLTVVREHIYIVINKPSGYLSSKLSNYDIKFGKKSIFSLLKGLDEKALNTLFCVGRLDEDSSGLLIITNDGNFSHKTTNPIFNVLKKYHAKLEQALSDDMKKKIEQGVEITLEENGLLTPYLTKECAINYLDSTRKNISITIQEGKKREIKRMMETVGNKVLALKRISIGGLNLEKLNIPDGKYRTIDKVYLLEQITNI
jgi:16S rRNA pseudouridine516 synthase